METAKAESAGYLDLKALQALGSLRVAVEKVVEGTHVGMHRSPLHGFSTEFAYHRLYAPGDDLRRMDWKVYARTERHYTKVYEAETNFDAYMLIDASGSMGYGADGATKLEYAKYLAACLAYLIVKQNDSAGLAVFDSRLRQYVAPSSTMRVLHSMERLLGAVSAESKTDMMAVIDSFAVQLRRRSVVMLFSDLFDQIESVVKGVQRLTLSGHSVWVVQILDRDELTFPFRGGFKFRGVESDGELIANAQAVRPTYMRRLDQFLNAARTGCREASARYLLVDTSTPLVASVRRCLRGVA